MGLYTPTILSRNSYLSWCYDRGAIKDLAHAGTSKGLSQAINRGPIRKFLPKYANVYVTSQSHGLSAGVQSHYVTANRVRIGLLQGVPIMMAYVTSLPTGDGDRRHTKTGPGIIYTSQNWHCCGMTSSHGSGYRECFVFSSPNLDVIICFQYVYSVLLLLLLFSMTFPWPFLDFPWLSLCPILNLRRFAEIVRKSGLFRLVLNFLAATKQIQIWYNLGAKLVKFYDRSQNSMTFGQFFMFHDHFHFPGFPWAPCQLLILPHQDFLISVPSSVYTYSKQSD